MRARVSAWILAESRAARGGWLIVPARTELAAPKKKEIHTRQDAFSLAESGSR